MSLRFQNTALFALSILAISAGLGSACSATGDKSSSGDGGDDTSGPGGPGSGGNGGDFITVGSAQGGAGGGEQGDPTTCEGAAQLKSYIGCDFWPTVTANNVWSIFDYAVVVANAGDSAANVTVTRGSQMVGSATVQPNGLSTIYLPWVPELKGPDADMFGSATPLTETVRVANGAYHLVSTRPVTVYQFNALEYAPQGGPPGKTWSNCPGDQSGVGCFSYSNDAALLLPSTTMTGNYRVASYAGWPSPNVGAVYTITGTEDATNVQIKNSGNGDILGGGGIPATGPSGIVSFSLGKGEVVEIVNSAFADPGGSLVYADKPVQVIAAVPCIQMPIGVQACDHIEETVFPVETLGKHYFVTVPTSPGGSPVGHVVRIFGNVNGTMLSYPGGAPSGAPLSINAGQVVDLGQVGQDFEIIGDHEFSVSSFQLGAQIVDPFNDPQRGDPAQSQMTAVEQYRDKYVFLAPTDYDESYVDVVMPTGTTVTVDGQDIGQSPSPIASGFGIARVPLGPGNNGAHVLTATAPVGIQVMGYGSYTSYQYPGGSNLKGIAPPPPPPN